MSARKALTPLTAAAAALVADPEEAEATFIGEKGARGLGEGVLRALDAARDMLKKDEPRRVIHKTTGWSVGKDGKWRYEIDDSGSRMVPNSIAAAAARSNTPVNQILRHDELFQLYPDRPLKDVEIGVGVGSDANNFGGAYYHGIGSRLGSDSILMNEGYRINPSVNPQTARSLLLHELQHAIQAREGFDPGANKEMFRDELGGPSVRMNMRSNLRGAKDALDILQMPGKPSIGDYSPTSPFADDFFNLYGRELSSNAADFKDYSQAEIERVIRDIEMDFETKQEPFEQYMRNAGETEARNVQHRANWGMIQRRDNLPSQSEDRPRAKQTLRGSGYAGGGKVVGPLRALSDKLGDVGEGFVSALERAIATSKQERMPAEQWQKYLVPGRKTLVEDVPFVLKQDELDYSNIPNLLMADPRAPRTAQELLEHLQKRNLPEFDERRGATAELDFEVPMHRDMRMSANQLIDSTNTAYADDISAEAPDRVYQALYGATPEIRRRAYEDLLDEGYEGEATEIRRIMSGGSGHSTTQYEDYTTRGPKEGYEENLTKWTPTHRSKINDERRDIDWQADEIRQQINTDQSLSKEQRDALALREHSLRQHSSRLSASLPEDTGNRPAFESGHFDEAGGNLLAHSRASRRVGPDKQYWQAVNKKSGNLSPHFETEEELSQYVNSLPESVRADLEVGPSWGQSPGIRIIEEIQSDWHQAGRDVGYKGENALTPEEVAEHRALWDRSGYGRDKTPNLTKEEKARLDELGKRVIDQERAPPKAPYQKTYPELEFRKQLLRAIAEGDEYLAWTPGEEQINRYGAALRKQVDELHWERGDDGKIKVVPMKRKLHPDMFRSDVRATQRYEDNPTPISVDERLEGLDERSLRNLVGKEMADQILASQDPKGVLSGDDLRIGGSGMRHFYDSVVPDIARRIAKQYEGEITEIPFPGVMAEVNPNMQSEIDRLVRDVGMSPFDARSQVWGQYKKMFPALRITPAMREKVRRIGVPLFGGAPAIPLSEIDFDGDGEDYDYGRAVSRGITPDDTGHWPSRSELEDDEAEALGLPWGSGVLLKGRRHETWPLTEQGEADAGYKIIKRGRRYYSVPVDIDVPEEPNAN